MSAKETNSNREPFVLEVKEHIPFQPVSETTYVTSDEICKKTSDLFKNVFADWEGCKLEVAPNGEINLAFVFNHGKYDNDAIVACERPGEKSSGSSVIDRNRIRDMQQREGDRYFLTEDGKDVIKELLNPKALRNGNPDWKAICGEFTETTPMNYYTYGQRQPQYTKVSFIDIRKVCGKLYGTRIDGDIFDYEVKIATPLNNNVSQYNVNPKFMLAITKVSTNNVNAAYQRAGLGTIGSGIIR